MNTEFEIENEEAVQGTEAASTAVAIKAVEFTLPALPEIPEVLNINGVEFSEKILRAKVDQIKTMKIKDFLDDEGYEKAKKELSLLTKTRTGSEKWRAAAVKPVNDLAKKLKAKVDGGNVIVTEGEAYLKSIMTPYENYKEEERQRQEKEKDERLSLRAKLLIDAGMIYNGAGTYNSPLDPAIFVVSDEMREFSDELWEETYVPIKSLFDQEEKRRKDEALAKENQAKELSNQVADLNEERTEMRREILDARGFVFNDGYYVLGNGPTRVSEHDILNASKDEWKELLNPSPKVEAAEFVSHTEPEQPIADSFATAPGASSIANDFEVEEAVEDIEHTVVEVDFDYSVTLDFTEEKPFIDFAISGNFKIRLFEGSLEEEALSGEAEEAIAHKDVVYDRLKFALIKTT